MPILTVILIILILIRIGFLLSSNTSNVKKTSYTPMFDYEIYSEANKKLSTERKEKEDFYKDAEFINKNCTRLEDFIINTEINSFDLRKLADLNNIQLQIPQAWYSLTVELIKELHNNEWDKKVSCIKEKYATLEFYTNHGYEDNISKIIRGYGYKSKKICQTCGEKGEERNSASWDYIACRKHYLEGRRKITIENKGFNYDGKFYLWDDIKNRSFEDLDHLGKYRFLSIELKNSQLISHSDSNFYIPKSTIGFGNFLNYLFKNSYFSNHSYARNFEDVAFCEICGYQSVYYDQCECCENDSWEGYIKRWKNEENSEEEKYDRIKKLQMNWILDEGEKYESKQKNYIKNTNYRILFSEVELKKYTALDYSDDNL